MRMTTDNTNGILSIISLLQRMYPEDFIGDDKEHYFTESNTFLVLLTNNSTIEIHKVVAQDAEISIGSVTNESLERIFKTFKKN